MLRGEVFREPLVCGQEHRAVTPAPLEDVFITCALQAQVSRVMGVLTRGGEPGGEGRWEVVVDE
jgi:hypothetical protein